MEGDEFCRGYHRNVGSAETLPVPSQEVVYLGFRRARCLHGVLEVLPIHRQSLEDPVLIHGNDFQHPEEIHEYFSRPNASDLPSQEVEERRRLALVFRKGANR